MSTSSEDQERSAEAARMRAEADERGVIATERMAKAFEVQTALLMKMAQAQGINTDTIIKNKTAYDGLYGSTGKQSAAAEANAHSLKVMDDAMANFNKTLTNTTASAVSFGKALLSNEQGFAKYNQSLSSAGDAAMSLGKNFGILGFALGGAIKGLTMAAEQFTKQADNTLKATDSLSKLGGAGSLTADQVLSMGHKAGLTSSNLDIMTKAAAKANTGMAGLGGTVGDGIKAFGDMTAVTKEQRMAFQRMGVSQEELMSQQADYVKLQELSGINLADQAKQGKNLKAASLDYAENLVRLSTLTGKTADDLAKEKMLANEVYEEQIQTQMEQAKIRQLREDGYKDQADDLQRQQDNRKRAAEEYVHSFGKEQGLQMARAARTGTFDQSTAGLATMGFDPAAQKRKIEEAKSKEEVDAISAANRDDMKKKREQMLLSAGSAVVYGGESVGKALGLGGTETAQAYGRMGSRSEAAALKDAQGKTAGLASEKPEENNAAGGAAATDPAQIARNKLTETEIAAKVELDKLIASFNPLLKGFDAGTIAALALATAAAAAALALGKMAASAVMNKMGGGGLDVPDRKGKGGKGGNHGGFGTGTKGAAREYEAKAGNKAYKSTIGTFEEKHAAQKAAEKSARKEFFENERASGGGGGGAGKVASAAGRLAGPAAGVIAVGAGAMTAYQGAKDVDEKVKKGELTKDEGTVKKSEAVGTGVGQAAGGAAGAWGGAATGAAIGSVVPVVGTLIGGLLGAAVGGWLGSKGGEIVGENVGKTVGKSMVEKPAVAGATQTAATDPKVGNATAATDPKVGNAIMKEEQESLSKGLANMVKEDQEKAKQAKEDAMKLTKVSETQEVTLSTLNKTLLATNTALTNLTASITNLSKPTASGGAGSMASLASKAAGGGISVPGGVPASFKSSGGGGAGAAGGLGITSGDMPTKSNKPTSQPPEEGGPGGGSGSATKTVDLAKIMKFGTNSGTQQNFEALDSSFKDAVTAAAKDYNATTGNKLQINSAKRDPADQQRIWDESVAAGREGKTASGMPIGKPGRSLHEKGQAIDIQNYKDPDAIAAMNKQGLTQKVPGDPVHFQAELGGIMNGPTTGYPVEGTMHGREAIIPLNPESIITKLLTTSEAQIKQEMNTNNSITTTADDMSSQIMSEMYAMMEEKFDAMIEALENGNDHTEKLVKFSAV